MLSLGPSIQINESDGQGIDRGPGPLASSDMWTDPLDDTSNVFMPVGGLVGVEVGGGEVRLKSGQDEGWIASGIIHAEAGFRYDFVLLEVDTPGGSSVEISVLNASEESTVIGFANGTIPGFVRIGVNYLSVFAIDPVQYPDIRIQVNLVADGADRPVLKAWTLYFSAFDEWRDEFYGTEKMALYHGLNITNGTVEVNRSGVGGSSGDVNYEAYPALVFSRQPNGGDKFNAFYPNENRTAYEDSVLVNCNGSREMIFEDLNLDGFLDLIMANLELDDEVVPSQIYWGDGSGKWNESGATDINSEWVFRMAKGDFDGDGDIDLVFANDPYGSVDDSVVFLNKGGGTFSNNPDVRFQVNSDTHESVATGDLNNDGYDDIILQEKDTSGGHAICYFGGPSGPDTTIDLRFTVGTLPDYILIEDIDGDDYLDVVLSITGNQIFLGGPNGPDTSHDYNLRLGSGQNPSGVAAGDINGDGWTDLVFTTANNRAAIFEGSSTGWSDIRRHDIFLGYYSTDVEVYDFNQDGYDDILTANNRFDIFFGGTTWPTSADITKTGLSFAREIGIAIGDTFVGSHSGYLVTESIGLPADKKWDMLVLDGTIPSDASVTLTILDDSMQPIIGYEDLNSTAIDIADLTHDTIHVKVSLDLGVTNTTPVLDSLTVKWMDKNAWRDQFYGISRIERTAGLGVMDGTLRTDSNAWSTPQLIFACQQSDGGFDTKSMAFFDAGGLDYLTLPPMEFETYGASAFDVSDVNDDGLPDATFAVQRTSGTNYETKSPMFINTATGWPKAPLRTFPTVGAVDVLLEDLNDDGYGDVVFAQQFDGVTYRINSTLFWGSSAGWNATPDLNFTTVGASAVEAADFDGDGRLDLVFACYKDVSTSTSSMVFLQGTGFDGTSPSFLLPTRGATAVDVADLNGDTLLDVVFANSFTGGLTEFDSWIYWGKTGGGFETTPSDLPTVGAMDVKIADLDGDGALDIVFANGIDNSESVEVDSYVYLNDGSGGFGPSPDALVPTVGAEAVAVGDLDGSGHLDLVFACRYNGSSFSTPSMVYLGDNDGWMLEPDIQLPTVGASDIMVTNLTKAGLGGYMSELITPEHPGETGAFHTLRYTADLGASQSGLVQLIDAITEEVLAETTLRSGTHDWSVEGAFRLREHPSIRVVIIAEGLEGPGAFEVEELWLNWTQRVHRHPEVLGLQVGSPTVLRSGTVQVSVTVMDEYDYPEELVVSMEIRHNETGAWNSIMLWDKAFRNGIWTWKFIPRVDSMLGNYDFRVAVMDSDMMSSGFVEFPNMVEVLNNPPSPPEVRITPARPITTSRLIVEIVSPAWDVESTGLTYRYQWYVDGVLQDTLTHETVDPSLTTKGQNWSVAVRAYDGEDWGEPDLAWRVIQNAPPYPKDDLPDLQFDEDTVSSDLLDLTNAFGDPDGDPLTWTVDPTPANILVEIDEATGIVTLRPEENWNGMVNITFVASDGELQVTQTVTVWVLAVNDLPWFAAVNGDPIETDPVEFTIKQGELLIITVLVIDPEGDELFFEVNTTMVTVDSATGEIRFQPGNEAVGTLRFGLWVSEVRSPTKKVKLNFAITVENENDPMDDPSITNPANGAAYKTNQSFFLTALCSDPDTQYGQVLNYTWSSNISGLLGYGSSLQVEIQEPGNHVITMTVTDGEFQKMVTVEIVIVPSEVSPPDPDNGGNDNPDPLNYGLIAAIIIILVVLGVVLFVARTKRQTEEAEAMDEEEYKRDHMERAYNAVKEAADTLEAGKVEAGEPADHWEEHKEPLGNQEVVVKDTLVPAVALSMEAKKTAAASKQTMALFGSGEAALEPVLSEEEHKELRLDNEKRKFQNAIGKLPYGIPSAELRDWDWVDLATALATGEKRMTPDGRETTNIDGRWYYSDQNDTGSFLKEHGARPKKKGVEATTDKTALLAKLEERFILGEISEKTYNKLVDKYSDEE